MKEEKKKTATKKTTVKKSTTKKEPVKKEIIKKEQPKDIKKVKEKVEPNLNETIIVKEENKKEPIINHNLIECNFCHQKYDKGYSICPHCHKRQKPSISLTFFIIFALVFIFGIITFHFVNKYIIKNVDIDYKSSCILVDYENLVRHPKEYKGKDIRIIGEVVEVEGYDTNYGNSMIITLNANLFDDGTKHLITVNYIDRTYNEGFIAGDIVTVYGKYQSINGNIPNIKAEYIIFGN